MLRFHFQVDWFNQSSFQDRTDGLCGKKMGVVSQFRRQRSEVGENNDEARMTNE